MSIESRNATSESLWSAPIISRRFALKALFVGAALPIATACDSAFRGYTPGEPRLRQPDVQSRPDEGGRFDPNADKRPFLDRLVGERTQPGAPTRGESRSGLMETIEKGWESFAKGVFPESGEKGYLERLLDIWDRNTGESQDPFRPS